MPQLLALAASLAFGIGSYFEKKGLHIADLSPQVGITVRTLTAVIVLAVISFPEWKTLTRANPKGVWMVVLGGGVLAGAIGLLVLLCRHEGCPTDDGDAHRLHFAAYRRGHGDDLRRRAADVEDWHRHADDRRRDRRPHHWLTPSPERIPGSANSRPGK